MAKGYGIDISDWVLVGVVAVGGYFVYKTLIKPTSDITSGGADIITTGENAFQNLVKTTGDTSNTVAGDIASVWTNWSQMFTGTANNLITSVDNALNHKSSVQNLVPDKNLSSSQQNAIQIISSNKNSGSTSSARGSILSKQQQQIFDLGKSNVKNPAGIKTGPTSITAQLGLTPKATPVVNSMYKDNRIVLR